MIRPGRVRLHVAGLARAGVATDGGKKSAATAGGAVACGVAPRPPRGAVDERGRGRHRRAGGDDAPDRKNGGDDVYAMKEAERAHDFEANRKAKCLLKYGTRSPRLRIHAHRLKSRGLSGPLPRKTRLRGHLHPRPRRPEAPGWASGAGWESSEAADFVAEVTGSTQCFQQAPLPVLVGDRRPTHPRRRIPHNRMRRGGKAAGGLGRRQDSRGCWALTVWPKNGQTFHWSRGFSGPLPRKGFERDRL